MSLSPFSHLLTNVACRFCNYGAIMFCWVNHTFIDNSIKTADFSDSLDRPLQEPYPPYFWEFHSLFVISFEKSALFISKKVTSLLLENILNKNVHNSPLTEQAH